MKLTNSEANFRQTSNTNFQTTDDGNGSQSCDAPNNNNLAIGAFFNVGIDTADAVIELHYTQTKTGAHSKHGANDAEDINKVSYYTVDEITKDWVKTSSHRHRKPLPVAKETEQKANDTVDDPSVNSPMEVG